MFDGRDNTIIVKLADIFIPCSPVEVDLQLLRLALLTARVSQASPPASLQSSEATHVDSSSGDNMPLLQSSELRSAECGSSSKAQSPGTQKDEKSR